jgi:hypothetical protein
MQELQIGGTSRLLNKSFGVIPGQRVAVDPESRNNNICYVNSGFAPPSRLSPTWTKLITDIG